MGRKRRGTHMCVPHVNTEVNTENQTWWSAGQCTAVTSGNALTRKSSLISGKLSSALRLSQSCSSLVKLNQIHGNFTSLMRHSQCSEDEAFREPFYHHRVGFSPKVLHILNFTTSLHWPTAVILKVIPESILPQPAAILQGALMSTRHINNSRKTTES